MNKENHKKCEIVIKTLMDKKDSVEFRQPVDYIGIDL